MNSIQKTINIYQKTYISKFLKKFYYNIIIWFETIGHMGLNLFYSIKCLLTGNLDMKKFIEQSARFGVDSSSSINI